MHAMTLVDIVLVILGILGIIVLLLIIVALIFVLKTIHDIKTTAYAFRDLSSDIRNKKLSELIQNPVVREKVTQLLTKRFGFFAPLFAAFVSFIMMRFARTKKPIRRADTKK